MKHYSPNYIAIDIETTGLDPEKDQIIEFAAVAWTSNSPIEELPSFTAVFDPRVDGRISGSLPALLMNIRLLRAINVGICVSFDSAMAEFRKWLRESLGLLDKAPFLVGKNLGTFDLKFLERHPSWPKDMFHYRVLDVGSMYATPAGIPSQSDLNVRIPGNEHEALYDARKSLYLARKAILNG